MQGQYILPDDLPGDERLFDFAAWMRKEEVFNKANPNLRIGGGSQTGYTLFEVTPKLARWYSDVEVELRSKLGVRDVTGTHLRPVAGLKTEGPLIFQALDAKEFRQEIVAYFDDEISLNFDPPGPGGNAHRLAASEGLELIAIQRVGALDENLNVTGVGAAPLVFLKDQDQTIELLEITLGATRNDRL
ncbi:hypothetical protein [uncultured Roseovarius sp.]|uniref:hypothetical protein n=1 Tax=uncultured Roseovarius sp. TaxID=293344 RepID=UPI002629F430|nr:hypothetical protein [uncultured Roseovarius sp.]